MVNVNDKVRTLFSAFEKAVLEEATDEEII